MPRYATGKTRVPLKELVRRSYSYRVTGYKRWIDPFPGVHGTLPEKMVYAGLSARGIPFLFLNNVEIAIPEIDVFKKYQADFIIPSMMLIIEVQGAHWHSQPATIEEDAFKFAMYQQKGYRAIAWWDYDIIARLPQLFAAEPLLAGYPALQSGSSELAAVDRTKIDTSQGIRTLNLRRAQRHIYKRKPVRVKAGRG